MASAKTAVVHRANLYDFWEQVAPPKPGHCAAADPDLSKLTLTGEARSAFRAEHSRIVSVVKIFRNGDMASEYLRSHVGAGELGCIRRGMTGYFQKQGISVEVLASRIDRSPPIGAESAIYSLQFLLSKGDGPSDLWPFQMYLFRVGRAVGVISFDFVATDQLKVARRVASNLDRV